MNKLYTLLLSALFLASCAGGRPAYTVSKPITYYAAFEAVPLFASPDATTSSVRSVNRNEQLIVVGRKVPNWLVVKQGDSIYYVLASVVSTSPNSTGTESSYRATGGSSHDIQTGPRGGKYYINGNGNKTYIKRK